MTVQSLGWVRGWSEGRRVRAPRRSVAGLTVLALVASVLGVSTVGVTAGVSTASPLDFAPVVGPNGLVNDLVVLPDGSVVIGGEFTEVDGLSVNYLARLQPDGALDKTFGPEPDGVVHDLDLLPDGRLLVSGGFTAIGGYPRDRVAITDASGSVDPTFAVTSGPNDAVFDAEVTSTGSVVVGGAFTSVGGTSRPRVARLTSLGARDPSFDPGTGPDDTVFAVALDSVGRVLLGGSFTSVAGQSWARLARLTTSGAPDTAGWAGRSADGAVFDIAPSGTGAVFVGTFTQIGSTARGRVARLDAAGQVDTTYATGTGFNNGANSISVGSDGSAVVVGGFVNFGAQAAIRVARLTTAGNLDRTFDVGNGPDALVTAVTHTGLASAPGSVAIGGAFSEVDTEVLDRVAILDGDGRPAISDPVRPGAPDTVSVTPGSTQLTLDWDTPTDPGTAAVLGYRVELSTDSGATWVRPTGSCALASTLSSTATTCTATGLTNGTPLIAAVVAVNANGLGAAVVSGPVTPGPVPARPAAPSVAVLEEGEFIVTFDPTAPVDAHTATASPGGATCTAVYPDYSCSITVGDPTVQYTVTAVADNSSGASPSSPASRPVLPGVCAEPPSPFTDVRDSDFFALGATCLLRLGITTENPFNPTVGVSRAQMATFLWRMAGAPASTTSCGFTDEAAIPAWARAAACWMKAEGITTTSAYDPARIVPRGQMAAFLWRWAGEPDVTDSCGFTDESAIPAFARQGACWLFVYAVTDRNPFQPSVSVTRAQMAAFLYRLGQNGVGQWL